MIRRIKNFKKKQNEIFKFLIRFKEQTAQQIFIILLISTRTSHFLFKPSFIYSVHMLRAMKICKTLLHLTFSIFPFRST